MNHYKNSISKEASGLLMTIFKIKVLVLPSEFKVNLKKLSPDPQLLLMLSQNILEFHGKITKLKINMKTLNLHHSKNKNNRSHKKDSNH